MIRTISSTSTDLISNDIPSSTASFRRTTPMNTPSNIQGLPEYQQSIKTFLKRQLSNTAAVSPSSITALDIDKDVIEIDLNEDFSSFDVSMPFAASDEHNEFQCPVYPAMFLNNDTVNGIDNEASGNSQVGEETGSYYNCYYGNTSVPGMEVEGSDYFALTVITQGRAF
jgi:hypothetical protein